MNIGIDARLYGTNHRGIGRYAEELAKNILALDKKNKYFIFLAKDAFADFECPNVNCQKVLADFRAYSWGEQFLFPRLLKKYKLDLVHFTHFNVPFFYRQRFFVTIHDLILSHYPDRRSSTLPFWLYRIKLFFYNFLIKSTARRAEKIITVSDFSKQDICRTLKVDNSKVFVTYEGASFSQASQKEIPARIQSRLAGFSFLLYVGSAYPHKNLSTLLKSFSSLVKEGLKYKLVLVGKNDYFYQRLEQEAKQLGLSDKVIFTGYLSDDELASLYYSASLYVFPSLMEGFGLPPLEAQFYGLPVASANTSCLPEILGDGALYFDPKDIPEMSQVIKRGVEDNEIRQKLITRGRINVSKYSWQDCANKTISICQG